MLVNKYWTCANVVRLQMLGFSEAGGNSGSFLQMLGFSEAGGNA